MSRGGDKGLDIKSVLKVTLKYFCRRVVSREPEEAKTPGILHGVLILSLLAGHLVNSEENFSLAADCPPGFLLDAGDRCRLKSLYQFYDSLRDRGLGGMQTGLPPHRDGFSPQQIDLGRLLFFDPLLSGDKNLSCANCHNPELGFSDGMGRSVGARGQINQRSAPTLWNTAFLETFFWDSRASSLEEQATHSLFSAKEMGNTPRRLIASLNEVSSYRKLFQDAFPGTDLSKTSAISVANVVSALAAFQTSLISLNSPYDRYAHGDKAAMTSNQVDGLNIFRSFVARCSQCHTPPLFTNQQLAVIGTPEPEGLPRDVGAEETFASAKLRGAFKVPTLRNITNTAPYMHSGRFSTLREAVEFYTKGRGHAVPKEEELLLHWHISEPNLTDVEIDLLVEFMAALNDERFMPNVPREVPSGLLRGIILDVAASSSGE